MSVRPSKNYSFGNTCPNNTTSYAIIGNTVAALMYVLKLRKEGITTPIHIISGIYSNLNNKGVEDLSYIPMNVKTILHSLLNDRIHYIGNEKCPTDPYAHYLSERCIAYTYGCGTLGDVISASKLPNFGPWFHKNNGNSKQIERFVRTFTTQQSLNTIEQTIADRLQLLWTVPFTATVTVNTPSIACKQFLLKKVKRNRYVREIFKDVYNTVSSFPDVQFHNVPDTLYFEPSTVTTGNYDIESRTFNLNNVNLIFKTNPYSYLSTATKGGICTTPLDIPAFYRAVIPITQQGAIFVGQRGTNNYGVNFNPILASRAVPQASNSCGCANPTTTNCSTACPTGSNEPIAENTFSLPDLDSQNSSNQLTWAGHQYLVDEDFFPTNQTGWFASTGYNLLIVECICYDNKRSSSFSNEHQEIQLSYNSKVQEEKFLFQFAKIVCDIIFAYTGTVIIPSSILADQSLTVSNGAAMDSNMVENITQRESSISILLEIIAGIYGSDFYVPYG